VLAPGGALFVYSHVRKNAPIAAGLRAINALARWLERRGLIDMTQERLRKSDHLNPLTDIPHLERVTAAAGFRIGKIRYYTPLIGGFVENILMRMTERALTRRAARQMVRRMEAASATPGTATAAAVAVAGGTDASAATAHEARADDIASTNQDATAAVRAARTNAKARIARGGPLSWGLHGLTALMQIDMLLFGRIRSGPFFALLVKDAARPTARQAVGAAESAAPRGELEERRSSDGPDAGAQSTASSWSPRPAQRGEG